MSVSVAEGAQGSAPASAQPGRAGSSQLTRLRAALLGSLASFGLLLLELSGVLTARSRELSSVWEIQNGVALLLPGFVAAAIVAGTTGGLALRLLSRADQ